MEAVKAKGREIRAVAINDYSATIPWSDLAVFPVLLALKHNGREMPVRDKGPIWIIYPATGKADIKIEPNNSKMVWQLKRLEVQ